MYFVEESLEKRKIDILYTCLPELKNHFDIHKEVGKGTFSTVYQATYKKDLSLKKYAVKHIVPTCHPDRIKLELKCLKMIGYNIFNIYNNILKQLLLHLQQECSKAIQHMFRFRFTNAD